MEAHIWDGSTHLGTSHASHGTQSTFMSGGYGPRGFQYQEDSKVAGLAWCLLVGSVFIFKLCETQHQRVCEQVIKKFSNGN